MFAESNILTKNPFSHPPLIGNIDNLSFFYFFNPVGDMSEISGEWNF